MASFNRVVFSGSSNSLPVNFPYIDKTHVTVSLDGVVQTSGFTWANSGLIQFDANPAAGVVGEARRSTPTGALTTFSDGNLDVGDLNLASLQPLYVAEEANENAGDVDSRSWKTVGAGSGGTISRGGEGELVMFSSSGDIIPGGDLGIPSFGSAAGQDVDAFASSADGELARGALPKVNVADFSSGSNYTALSVLEREANLLMFGPDLANGANVSTAMQVMMTAAAAAGKTARIPAHPLGFPWTLMAGVLVPGVKVVCDEGAVIQTNADIDMFTFTAHSVRFNFGIFEHYGDGKVFNSGAFEAHRIVKPQITLHKSSALDTGILILGSNTYLEEPAVTNFRTLGYWATIRKVPALININTRIEKPYAGGTGLGILVDSQTADNRPEGVYIINPMFVLTGAVQIKVRTVLYVHIINGMLDRGGGAGISLDPTGLGIDGCNIFDNWISPATNPTGPTGGVGIKSETSAAGIGRLKVRGNSIRYCSYGIALTDNVNECDIEFNLFTDIDQADILGPADNWNVTGNRHSDSADFQLSITEGAGGGYVKVSDEIFSTSGGAISLSIATRSRWTLGNSAGKKLRGTTWATTGSSPSSGSYVNIPHGLITTPAKERVILSCSFASGGYTKIIVNVAAVDATNITAQIWYETQVTAGALVVAAVAEI